MGAEDRAFSILGCNETCVRQKIKEKHEQHLHDYGHRGYTGSWAEWNGGVKFHTHIGVFKTQEKAYEYLFGKYGKKSYKPGVVQKWEDAIVVQYRDNKGKLVWMVGACFSC
jgi:hypothetical protein